MSKYFIPVEIDRKWWVVENAPEEKDFIDDGQDFYIMRYYAALESCTKYPTLESDSAYWASKEGVKMTSEEFEVRTLSKVSEETVDKLLHQPLTISEIETLAKQSHVNYAIPIQSPTTKELIEQEANNYIKSNSPNELIYNTGFYTGFVKGANFALSLPKQDNGDAWDEAEQLSREFADSENQQGANTWSRVDLHDWWLSRFDYLKQHYSISKK